MAASSAPAPPGPAPPAAAAAAATPPLRELVDPGGFGRLNWSVPHLVYTDVIDPTVTAEAWMKLFLAVLNKRAAKGLPPAHWFIDVQHCGGTLAAAMQDASMELVLLLAPNISTIRAACNQITVLAPPGLAALIHRVIALVRKTSQGKEAPYTILSTDDAANVAAALDSAGCSHLVRPPAPAQQPVPAPMHT